MKNKKRFFPKKKRYFSLKVSFLYLLQLYINISVFITSHVGMETHGSGGAFILVLLFPFTIVGIMAINHLILINIALFIITALCMDFSKRSPDFRKSIPFIIVLIVVASLSYIRSRPYIEKIYKQKKYGTY